MERAHTGHQACWRISGGRRLTPAPFLVAGIVNITPDSFSDGGRYVSPDAALTRVRRIVAEGADMADLGAESTRPGADDIGHGEEWRRLEPVLTGTLALRSALVRQASPSPAAPSRPPFAVSIDTFRAETAARALAPGKTRAEAGADIINDVSGGTFDPAMADVLAEFTPGYVLGHSPALPGVMQKAPRYGDVVDELMHWFSTRLNVLIKAGLPEECICLDPCVGFGKNLEHNLAVCAAAPRFAALGRPLYYGISRKTFLGALLGTHFPQPPPQDDRNPASPSGHPRDSATQIAVALLARDGVAIHRVHQVADTVATLKIVQGMGMQG